MSSPVETVGRNPERALLGSLIDAMREGRGGVRLLAGEPGIGKSHLASRLAEAAEAEGVSVVWGRCWEAGGAPAFWPWIEVLRALLGGRSSEEILGSLGPQASVLAELVPSVAGVEPPPPLEAREAQFRLFDGVATFLRRFASERPLLIVLEDLHAADATSVSLLELVARSLSTTRVGVVGTYRVSDARLAGVLDGLSRVGRLGETIHLEPLTNAGVARLVELVTGSPPSDEQLEVVAAASEGNPLFVGELSRLMHARSGDPSSIGESALPGQIAAVIGERVERLPEATAALLRTTSVLGRELHLVDAAALVDASSRELIERLDPAIRAGLVAPAGPSTYRFTHVLVAEALQRALPVARRSALHLRIASALEERHRGDPAAPLSRIAHHFLEAGAEAEDRGVHFAIRAAERALAVLAHAEAAELYERALGALEAIAPDASARRCALLLSVGHARLQAGDLDAGKTACRAAAQLARILGSPELLARAALEHGSVFSFGLTDPELVSLLEEALAGLPEEHTQLRARLLARLAAALQPAPDPEGPIRMAREAIDLAREHGDDRVVLAVLRSACSAMMDYTDPRERIPLNRDHVTLAKRLGEPAEVFRGRARLIFDHLELGEVEEADRIIETYEGAARSLGHPAFEWIACAVRAMRAIMSGRFAEAEALRDEAARHASRSGDANAHTALEFQKVGLVRARWDDAELDRLVEGPCIAALPAKHRLVLESIGHAQRGDRDALALSTRDLDGRVVATAGDPHFLTLVAEMAALLDDRDVAEPVYRALAPYADRSVSWGMVCIYNEGPIEHWLAILAWTLGDREEASVRFDRALERARRVGMWPMVARVAYEHGRRLLARPHGRERGLELLREARRLAEELDIPGLARRLDALDAEAQPTAHASADAHAASASPPRFELEGDVWAIEFAGSTVRVRSTKGLQIMARLVGEPGREHHVLDLGSAGGGVSENDTGELIDARARDAYRRRAQELREELAEATEWNDLGRAAQARGELEQLEAELRRALGLGGRKRTRAGSAERARTNVQKRIRAARKSIAEHHPRLAEHLARTIRTGVFCSYEPLPE